MKAKYIFLQILISIIFVSVTFIAGALIISKSIYNSNKESIYNILTNYKTIEANIIFDVKSIKDIKSNNLFKNVEIIEVKSIKYDRDYESKYYNIDYNKYGVLLLTDKKNKIRLIINNVNKKNKCSIGNIYSSRWIIFDKNQMDYGSYIHNVDNIKYFAFGNNLLGSISPCWLFDKYGNIIDIILGYDT